MHILVVKLLTLLLPTYFLYLGTTSNVYSVAYSSLLKVCWVVEASNTSSVACRQTLNKKLKKIIFINIHHIFYSYKQIKVLFSTSLLLSFFLYIILYSWRPSSSSVFHFKVFVFLSNIILALPASSADIFCVKPKSIKWNFELDKHTYSNLQFISYLVLIYI